ncbi:MAG: tRNA (adenosine(37)-N6)-dimethylallyltransferase MiaA [Firmicutes bacterium]|nr:tRNA (adenosine(37)-N6)-dimethylallyltransferase MiaA [Bacillota bacterium]
MQKPNSKLLIITGPTGIGKSSLSVDLAMQFNGEIISSDSMQVYKGLDIGTGKIKELEMRGVAHHMLDIVGLDEEYSVGKYKNAAEKIIDDINSRGKLPITAGGTGLYIEALINGLEFGGVVGSEKLRAELSILPKEELYEKLKNIDEKACEKISINDTKRVIRALEIFYLTGKRKSDLELEERQRLSVAQSRYDYLCVVLTKDRDKLYKGINDRVDGMIKDGLIEEAGELYERYMGVDAQFKTAIGYKELFEYFKGEMTMDRAIEAIKQNSRRYAKRQITFFKHMRIDKVFVDVGESGAINRVMDLVNEKLSLFN